MGLLQQRPEVVGGRVRERRTSPNIGLGGSVRGGARRDDAERLWRDGWLVVEIGGGGVAGARTSNRGARVE